MIPALRVTDLSEMSVNEGSTDGLDLVLKMNSLRDSTLDLKLNSLREPTPTVPNIRAAINSGCDVTEIKGNSAPSLAAHKTIQRSDQSEVKLAEGIMADGRSFRIS